jgi:crossover junction endodeoxyribonuclease RuvC
MKEVIGSFLSLVFAKQSQKAEIQLANSAGEFEQWFLNKPQNCYNKFKLKIIPPLMRILGIDPGLATIGFAVIDITDNGPILIEVGVIETAPHQPVAPRLKEIYDDLTEIISQYKPTHSSVEEIFFSKNVTTGIKVSQARGVILLALEEAGVEIHEFNPSAMKRALTGDGKASKKAIQKMLMLELGLEQAPKPDDAADALSLALTLSFELRNLARVSES